MPDQEFKILITGDASSAVGAFAQTGGAAQKLKVDTSDLSDETRKLLSGGKDLNKEMGVITVSQADVEKATLKTSEATKDATEKFGESRREIRLVGNELGRAAGISGVGGLFLGRIAAAAFAAAKAIEFLKDTWVDIRAAITGPINIGIPADAPAHISAAATAWQQYADARAKVIASQNSPEASASAEERRLENELKLIKQVMAAEKEKALADLELHKGEMSPEAYEAARQNIGNIFGEAETKADENTRRQHIANKAREAENLEIDARKKTQEALGIKAAPAEVAENLQKTLDANAASGEAAKKIITDNLAMIARQKKSGTGNIAGTDAKAGDVVEYEGVGGKLQQMGETWEFKKKYGYTASIEDARGIEETRLAQAQAQIDEAEAYRKRQAANSEKKKTLMEAAGAESGKAAGLRGEVKTETEFEAQQNATDAHVAALHQSSANHIAGASQQTAAAVERFTAVTVGGFQDVHATFLNHQQQIEQIRRQLRTGFSQR